MSTPSTLHGLFSSLQTLQHQQLATPPECPRRASVALIVRIRPSYQHWPADEQRHHPDLDDFFAQDWVQHGDPEVLFIKRAARKGDRWTSHIALPGGKRDPEDADDQAVAIRETSEEVGLDLAHSAIKCGQLPQRIVTAHWGKKPLLVLCPYIFLLTTHTVAPLRLQPTEVASTHWVPLRCLQSPFTRTAAFEDASSRLANQETGVKKWMLKILLGKMMFTAIHLRPTESLYSPESPGHRRSELSPLGPQDQSVLDRLKTGVTRVFSSAVFPPLPPAPRADQPLLLWGLTLGVVSDFLDLLPPHNAMTLWSYPTFTSPDVRLAVWLMSYGFRGRKRMELQSESCASISAPLAHHDPKAPTETPDRPDEAGLHGLGTGRSLDIGPRDRQAAVATMLDE